MTREEREQWEKDNCEYEQGGTWMELREGWGNECYTGEWWQDCVMKGDDYT